jgi:PAS domain S-box-containing protein
VRKDAERAQRDSDRRIREIVDSLPQHVWMADESGEMVFLNQPLLDYSDLSGTDVAAWIELIHPDDRETCRRAWDEARDMGAASSLEARLRSRDGTYRWFHTHARPLRDADGSIRGWLGSNTDVHDVRELRDALARDEERHRQIVSAAPGGICAYRVRPDGTTALPYANARVAELYGYPLEALAADMTPLWQNLHPGDVARCRAQLAESATTLATWHGEYRYLHPDGRVLWIQGHATPTREPDGSVLWYGFLLDVTAQKRADETLRTSQAQLVAALKAGAMGSFVWDLVTGRFVGDAAVMGLWGAQPEEADVTWSVIEERIHPEDRARVHQQIETLMRDGAPNELDEYRVMREDGGVSWLATHAVVEHDADGRPVKLAGVHVDVTERKRSEEVLLRGQKLEALGTLAGGIAHDFNNVLAAIRGNAELAAQSLPAEHPAADSIAEIERASDRAAALVRRILAFSRPQDPQREVVSLAPVVEEALRLVRATLPATIDIRRSVADDLPPVSIDGTQVHQVIVNLATNAAHAIGARAGRVELLLDAVEVDVRESPPHPGLAPGSWVRLTVSDDGGGMEDATLERIFDPFFTTKAPGEGTGLGLSVVHGIMQSHGGAIVVRSEPGVGSTFELWFPAAHPTAARATPSADPAHEAPIHGRGRILYVDDEPAIVRLAARSLEDLGYEVVGCSDPARAWTVFCEHPAAFDFVVTDAAMPGLSGLDLAKDLLASRPDIPILMTSGHVRPEDELDARAAGVRELLQKPFSIRQLGRALDRLRTTGAGPSKRLSGRESGGTGPRARQRP